MDLDTLPVGRLWAGHIYGTNTGNIFLELDGPAADLGGTLKLADNQFGVAVLKMKGTLNEGLLHLVGSVSEAPDGVEFGQVSAKARHQPNESFSGEWTSTAGTGGTFQLFPHVGANVSSVQSSGPEQLYTTTRELGVLRLYKNDVLNLIGFLKKKFPVAKIVVSHVDRGAELALFSAEFEAKLPHLAQLTWIKLNVHGGSPPLLPQSVTIDLGPCFNRVTTQGADESWVLGEAEALSSFLRVRERKLSTRIGKYGINLDILVALISLTVLPELPLLQRLGFVALVFVVLRLASVARRAWIPNFVAHLDEPESSAVSRAWPSILSWIVSMTAALAAAVAYGLLQSTSSN